RLRDCRLPAGRHSPGFESGPARSSSLLGRWGCGQQAAGAAPLDSPAPRLAPALSAPPPVPSPRALRPPRLAAAANAADVLLLLLHLAELPAAGLQAASALSSSEQRAEAPAWTALIYRNTSSAVGFADVVLAFFFLRQAHTPDSKAHAPDSKRTHQTPSAHASDTKSHASDTKRTQPDYKRTHQTPIARIADTKRTHIRRQAHTRRLQAHTQTRRRTHQDSKRTARHQDSKRTHRSDANHRTHQTSKRTHQTPIARIRHQSHASDAKRHAPIRHQSHASDTNSARINAMQQRIDAKRTHQNPKAHASDAKAHATQTHPPQTPSANDQHRRSRPSSVQSLSSFAKAGAQPGRSEACCTPAAASSWSCGFFTVCASFHALRSCGQLSSEVLCGFISGSVSISAGAAGLAAAGAASAAISTWSPAPSSASWLPALAPLSPFALLGLTFAREAPTPTSQCFRWALARCAAFLLELPPCRPATPLASASSVRGPNGGAQAMSEARRHGGVGPRSACLPWLGPQPAGSGEVESVRRCALKTALRLLDLLSSFPTSDVGAHRLRQQAGAALLITAPPSSCSAASPSTLPVRALPGRIYQANRRDTQATDGDTRANRRDTQASHQPNSQSLPPPYACVAEQRRTCGGENFE
uniref:Protein kinase domain-containing protein n=1 Tax=Macrostomum lignano TaxID=282301 RepID=A0A1I8F6B5_9PLAT